MVKSGDTLESVLTQGLEFAIELKNQLNPATASEQLYDSLLEKVLSSYDMALKLLDRVPLLGNGDYSHVTEGLDQSSRNLASKDGSKKRKALPKWSEQVKVETGIAGVEGGQLDDGYSWRKYGQKNILGSTNPRAYYRCTHRPTQGCLATKQVQRADGDPSIVEVSYRGRHSCMQQRIKQDKKNGKKELDILRRSPKPTTATQPVLKLEPDQDHIAPFSFPSTQIEYENAETEFFPEPGSFVGTTYSPPFLSPATSESYFSMSQCNVNDFGIGQSLQSSESDFGEIISNPKPAGDMLFEEMDFSIYDLNFGSHFLDALDYI